VVAVVKALRLLEDISLVINAVSSAGAMHHLVKVCVRSARRWGAPTRRARRVPVNTRTPRRRPTPTRTAGGLTSEEVWTVLSTLVSLGGDVDEVEWRHEGTALHAWVGARWLTTEFLVPIVHRLLRMGAVGGEHVDANGETAVAVAVRVRGAAAAHALFTLPSSTPSSPSCPTTEDEDEEELRPITF
jgi:hypothetical protein